MMMRFGRFHAVERFIGSAFSLARNAVLASIAMAALGALPAKADEKGLLAPTGRLRVGVYPGSPTSMIVDP